VPKFIFPTFGPTGFFPKLVRSRVDLLFARFWHCISPSWSTAPPSGGLGHIGGTVPDQLGETGHPIQVHMKPLVPRRRLAFVLWALQHMALAGLSRSGGFVIKMAPARGSAPRPFQIARRSSGYPSGVPIEAGKRGNVCSVLNRTCKNIELPALLGTCSVAESRIHRSRGIMETNREKVAAPAISSQSTGAVSKLRKRKARRFGRAPRKYSERDKTRTS
jgi:hypothetical protein